MNPDEIYAKTEEGVRELKERTHNLPIALRSAHALCAPTPRRSPRWSASA
jgi:hypothetical protein